MPAHTLRNALAAAVACLAAALAHADAPLRTDSGDIPERGTCKVETWYEGTSGSPGYVVAPACVPFGEAEYAAAFARSRDANGEWGNAYALQAKFAVVRPGEDRPFALATTISGARGATQPDGGIQVVWLNVPATLFLQEDRWRVHVDVGGLWRRSDSDLVTWGTATEYDTGPVTWLAEAYRIDSGKARYNAGARFEVTDGFTVYVSAGRQFGADPGSWLVTAGIKLESPTALKGLGEKTASAGRAIAMRGPATPAP